MPDEGTSGAPRVFMRHVRQAGLCSRGSREWCRRNGMDWSAFLSDGMPAETLLATGDPIVARVVAAAQSEAMMREAEGASR